MYHAHGFRHSLFYQAFGHLGRPDTWGTGETEVNAGGKPGNGEGQLDLGCSPRQIVCLQKRVGAAQAQVRLES